MRPGPGLVVMALAFISGARRGSSTSQQQKQLQDEEEYHHRFQQQQQQQQRQYQQLSDFPNIYDNLQITFANRNVDSASNYLIYSRRVENNNNNDYVSYNKLGKIGHDTSGDNDNRSGTGGIGSSGVGHSALSRVNPWLSACDLAQPNQAPDLQGQCLAGTLPVAWVDEGPGPPRCPHSCEQLRLEKELFHKNRFNDNKNINNNIINNKFLSNSANNKNNNNFNTMDLTKKNGNELPAHQQMMTVQQQQQQHLSHQQQQHQQQHNRQQQPQQQQQKHQQPQQSQQQQQQHQCLDYLGDTDESSPAQLCKKSRTILAQKLRLLRMRHCCERNVFSALHTLALNATLNGGSECVRTLNDVLEMDALATRITCEFNEILVRYDCRQTYSLIHHCEDCREAYRRWVCSTLIPYFAEPEDIRQKTTTSNSINKTENHSAASSNLYHTRRTSRSTRSLSDNNNNNAKMIISNSEKTKIKNNDVQRRINSGTSIMSQSISTAITNPIVTDPLLDRILKRTKRKSEIKRRKRLRPCLSVCQAVEQICPYMLPADRAPAYPTQYAGEPTFLCLDPHIPETGEQFRKSNNGPDNCCYRYCGAPPDGICAHCDPVYLNQSNRKATNTTDPLSSSSSSSLPPSSSSSSSTTSIVQHPIDSSLLSTYPNAQTPMVKIDNIYYYDDYNDVIPPETIANCQNVHSTTPTSTHPCTIPYYATSSSSASSSSSSSAAKFVSMLLSYRFFILWTIFWCLVNITITNYSWTKNDNILIILLRHVLMACESSSSSKKSNSNNINNAKL